MQYCLFKLPVEHASFILNLYQPALSEPLLLLLLEFLCCWTEQYSLNHCWDSVDVLWSESADTCLMQILLYVSLLMQCIDCELSSAIYSLSVLILLMWSDLCHSQSQTSLFRCLSAQTSSVTLIWRIKRELKREKSSVKSLLLWVFIHFQILRRLSLCITQSKSIKLYE